MARRKKTDKAVATPAAAPTAPRFAYIGPPGSVIRFPNLQLVFRPNRITDNQVTAILQRHPQLRRYFSDAMEEE